MFTVKLHELRLAQADRMIKPLVGLLAAAFAVVPASAFAVLTDDPITTPTITSADMPDTSGMTPDAIRYSVLADPKLDYFTIMRAKAYGLTDDQIADAYALADETLRSFPDVINQVESGATFPVLAEEWGVPLEDVYSPERYRDRIHDFIAAYQSTGYGALRNHDADQNWPDWVDWRASAPAPMDMTIPSSTDTTISGSSSSTTTTITTPMTPAPGATTTPAPQPGDNGLSTTTPSSPAPTAPASPSQ